MCGDLLNLRGDVAILSEHDFDYLHLDVMDGHFVPNITFGFDLINGIGALGPMPKDIHLMMEHPELAIKSLDLNEEDIVTFHIECKSEILSVIRQIQARRAQVGLAINPETPLEEIFRYLDYIDHVLVMTVPPGFAGQPFVTDSQAKIKELVTLLEKDYPQVTVGVDGAIGIEEIKMLSKFGVNHFVLGTTALFKDDLAKRAAEVSQLKNNIG